MFMVLFLKSKVALKSDHDDEFIDNLSLNFSFICHTKYRMPNFELKMDG